MKKTISKTAALAMAVMLAGAALPMNGTAYDDVVEVEVYDDAPIGNSEMSAASDKSDKAMKEALTIVKKRVTVPEELSEFNYSTSESYSTKGFRFTWTTPNDAKEYKYIEVSIVGDIIVSYESNLSGGYSYGSEPRFAKLSEAELLEKAKAHLKKLDPSVIDHVKLEVTYFSLNSSAASVSIDRYENGVKVRDNNGSMSLDKDTGELKRFSLSWADNAKFDDPKTAKTEAEIEEAYKKLCKLTPYYKTTTDWQTGKKTTRIVYHPDFTSEIDAFTGKPSTIWEDMKDAEGRRLSYVINDATADAGVDYDDDLAEEESGVEFTEAELKKIQQDEGLLTKEQVFELCKKDKFVALTDDYEISSYRISSGKYPIMVLDNEKGIASPQKDKEEEKFYININFRLIKDEKKKDYKEYDIVNVYLDAETGEIISMSKWGLSSELPKLNVKKSNAIADEVAKTYGKDIVKEYKADERNTDPVYVWKNKVKTSDGKVVETESYETSRSFTYSRYVNGIQVYGDYINVDVDSNGVVTGYNSSHTEAAFPSADDILTPDEAFDKLYKQQKFNYYYDGWVAKDGSVKTYLIYNMDSFYLNAKTGKLCWWDGSAVSSRVSASDVKYTDIKGIPQEQAILTMQKYGIVLTTDSKFDPTGELNEDQFRNLLSSALGGYVYADEEVPVDGEGEGVKKPKTLTRELAAVIFADYYDRGGITKLNGIFKTPYSDVKSSDENAGAIAVAYAKGFFDKGDGKFGGSKKVTRAEAIQLIYDYILLLSK